MKLFLFRVTNWFRALWARIKNVAITISGKDILEDAVPLVYSKNQERWIVFIPGEDGMVKPVSSPHRQYVIDWCREHGVKCVEFGNADNN